MYLKKYLGPPCAKMALLALTMLGRDAAEHIIVVLITSKGVVAAAAKAPLTAPIAKSSCRTAQVSHPSTASHTLCLQSRTDPESSMPAVQVPSCSSNRLYAPTM